MEGECQVLNNGIYHIRVRGRLDEKWSEWFEGFALSSHGQDETQLSGSVPDQSALHGVLGRLHSLGLTLQLVALVDCPCSSNRCAHRGSCRDCLNNEQGRGALPACMREKSKWDKRICKLIADEAER
jgi:hypothetical protein